MLRQVLRHSVFYSLSSVTSSLISIAMLPVYVRWLQPAELGTFDLLMGVIALANMTISLEVVQAVMRFYPEERDPLRRSVLESSSWWFTVAAYSLAVLGSAAIVFPALLGEAWPARRGFLMVASVWTSGLLYYCGTQVRWQMRPRRFAVMSGLRSLLSNATAVVFMTACDAGLDGMIAGHIVGTTAPLVWCVWQQRHVFRARPDAGVLGELLSYSAPIVPASLSVCAGQWIDRLAIGGLMSLEEVGHYGIAVRFALLVTLASSGVQQALMPQVFARHHHPETPGQLAHLFSLSVVLSLATVLFLDFFARELLLLLTGRVVEDAAGAIPFLAASACATSLVAFLPGLSIARQRASAGRIYALGAAVNTVFNLALIPAFGILGAAVATLMANLLTLVLFARASQARYPAPHAFHRLIGWGCLPLALAALHHTSLLLSPDGRGVAVPLRAVIWAAAVLLLCRGLVVRTPQRPIQDDLQENETPTITLGHETDQPQ